MYRLAFENGRARNQRLFLLKLTANEKALMLTLVATVLAFILACSRFISTCSNYLQMKIRGSKAKRNRIRGQVWRGNCVKHLIS